jgi:hypothetical protein
MPVATANQVIYQLLYHTSEIPSVLAMCSAAFVDLADSCIC